jgi:Putative zinc-finger
MNEIDHDMCSELLRPYVAGQLDAPRERQVADHLAGCSDCSLELQAVRGLLSVTEPSETMAPLSELERAGLTRGVRIALSPAPRESLWDRIGRRAAPALGAAALLVIVAVAIVSTTSDEPITADIAGQAEGVDEDAGTDDAEGRPGALPKAAKDTNVQEVDREAAGTGAASESLESAASSSDAEGGGGNPYADAAPGQTLSRAGALYMTEDSFAAARFDTASLVPARLPNRRDTFSGVRSLRASAPNSAIGALIERCARHALATSSHPLVPTYARYYRGDDVLVIAFVWIERPSRDLNYELRGWRERSCESPSPIYRRGRLP